MTLEEIGGDSPAHQAAADIVSDLAAWRRGSARWSELPHSLMLTGAPGTGKSVLARAIAATAGVPIVEATLGNWQSAGHLGDMLREMRRSFAQAKDQRGKRGKGFPSNMPVAPAHHYKKTYSQDVLDRLVKTYSIPARQRDTFENALEDAAAIWRWYRAAADERTAPSQSSKALQDLSKTAKKLYEALSALPRQAEVSLIAETDRVGFKIFEGTEDPAGLPVLMVPQDDGTCEPVALNLKDYVHLLDAFQRIAADAAKLPPGRKGAKRDDALRMWIANIETLWTQRLERAFTRDVHEDGTPLTSSARFCVDVFSYVDPDTPTSRIMHEMKLRITATRQRSTGRISPQNGG
ncbi:ATPase family protein associated with various cellular activities (AAA) [Rhodobacter sp. JA431]|uniref:AAA family ATPase n=1 Tax=Rhodobacter sp. JA431 TaxID=570013 RepID=UPI000BD9A54C|nr:AAA family ATPase [Rhodobacter sp. JA431]SOC22136.1 ATPase family protein associated with various cellular activities (AAA) [Rhodobacter sp. JA431]